MAAYAALTSLKYIIHNLQTHPSPPISINEQQVRSLTEVVTFLQEFLKGYKSSFAYSDEADPFETRIADAAYAAEDSIESRIVDRIQGQNYRFFRSRTTIPVDITGEDLNRDLNLVIEEMDLIKKEALTVHRDNTSVQTPLQSHASTVVGSSSTSSSSTSSSMVGFDDVLKELLESLVRGQPDLQIMPITGMGGIGKTTLTRNLFENALVKEHFKIHAWTAISQNYNAKEALKELLSQAKANSSGESEDELGRHLYQHLFGRRYLIVLDDMWSIEVWDKIRHYFPNNENESRVIVTTRISNLASHLNKGISMKFLDEESSWNLFSKTVFDKESCPLELEEIGKNIVKKCRGLPLSIVTTGGLLAKSERTLEYWKHIERNLNLIVNSEDDEYCLRVLKMSYNHLPVHLKPCFLYMGMFKEDEKIPTRLVMRMWVMEGLIEPSSEKSLEIIAEENIKELVDRNLILVGWLGSTGNMKSFKIHDLLRDLSIREAEKERFYGVVQEHIPQGINSMRRIAIQSTLDGRILETLRSMSHILRSIVISSGSGCKTDPFPLNLRLLRMMAFLVDVDLMDNFVFELVNSRWLILKDAMGVYQFTSSPNSFWNLHRIICDHQRCVDAPIEIWNMPHLRHVAFVEVCLPDPPADSVFIMENLHTLKKVMNFKLNRDVIKRIPYIKKLCVKYDEDVPSGDNYCLNVLECLHKLESFKSYNYRVKVDDFLKKLTFPQSLKKLNLVLTKHFDLEEMLKKIGALPLLQKLKLSCGFFRTSEWRTAEGEFRKLKFLKLDEYGGLEQWILESSHFPLLKEIHLYNLKELKEISSEFGELPNLQQITLRNCSVSIAKSLKRIVEEQEDLQGEEQLSFKVQVYAQEDLQGGEQLSFKAEVRGERDYVEALQSLAGPNFKLVEW